MHLNNGIVVLAETDSFFFCLKIHTRICGTKKLKNTSKQNGKKGKITKCVNFS